MGGYAGAGSSAGVKFSDTRADATALGEDMPSLTLPSACAQSPSRALGSDVTLTGFKLTSRGGDVGSIDPEPTPTPAVSVPSANGGSSAVAMPTSLGPREWWWVFPLGEVVAPSPRSMAGPSSPVAPPPGMISRSSPPPPPVAPVCTPPPPVVAPANTSSSPSSSSALVSVMELCEGTAGTKNLGPPVPPPGVIGTPGPPPPVAGAGTNDPGSTGASKLGVDPTAGMDPIPGVDVPLFGPPAKTSTYLFLTCDSELDRDKGLDGLDASLDEPSPDGPG